MKKIITVKGYIPYFEVVLSNVHLTREIALELNLITPLYAYANY